MDEKLQALVSQLLREGKSDQEIKDFIRQYKEENEDTTAFHTDSSGFNFNKTNVYDQDFVYGEQREPDEDERNAIDYLKSYGANLGKNVVSVIDNLYKGYETGEYGYTGELIFEGFGSPFGLEFIAGEAADLLRDRGYNIPNQILGFDLMSPGSRKELYETHMLEAREKGLSLREAQALDPTNRVKFEGVLDWFDKHTYVYRDENGNPMDYLALINEGRYGDAADAFTNDAFGAVPSLIISRLPYGIGAAMLGAGAYMDNFEREMYKRGFNDETTRNQVVKDSIITGSSDFVMELIGGRIINNIIGKGVGKEKAVDLLTKLPQTIAGKMGLGFASEFTTEGLTGVTQDLSKAWNYGDKVTFKSLLRTFFKDGFIGGFLGAGSTGVSFAGLKKEDIYEYVATDQYKQEQLKIEEEIINLTKNSDKAEGKTKDIINKEIDALKKKKEVNKANLFSFFDSMTDKAKKKYAENIDKRHEQLDIMLDNRIDNKTREKAKKEYEKAIKANNKFFRGTDLNYDADLEVFLGQVLKNTEKILEQKKFFGFNKDNLDIEYVTSDSRVQELNNKFKGFNAADGMFYDNTGGKNKIYINVKAAAATGQTNVLGHEYLHAIISRAFSSKIGKSALKGSVSEFVKYLNDIGQADVVADIEARLATQYDALDSDGNVIRDNHGLVKTKDEANQEEYFNIFSDIIKKNKIEAVESKSTGIKNSFRSLLRGFGFGEVDFQNGQQVFDFLVDYNTNINRASILNKLTARGIAKVKLKGLEPKKDKRFKEGTDVLRTPTTKASKTEESINKLGKTLKTKDGVVIDLEQEGLGNFYFEAEAENIYKEIRKKGLLDAFILAQPHEGVDNKTFLDSTYTELYSWFKKYQPERKNPDGLFGHINSQIGNRAKQAYNAITKGEIKGTKEIGETTKEGEIKTQVAAETDAPTKALETEDLSIAARIKRKVEANKKKIQKTSKFRKQLGIATGSEIYNRVLDSARKALIRAYESGKPARNVQRNLRNEANTYLFKTIKNFLGTNTYISNLKNFREAIVDVMFTADLVQLEREVSDDKKVFTKFVKQLTSKEEVQNAVDQNLLPPSALNVIDKGQAVNLYKKVMPTEEQFIKFFDQPSINPVTGKRSGLKGTRKDQLAKYMSGALAYDATMEVAQEPEVIQKRADIAALNGETLAEDNIQALADQINRDPNVKFSISTSDSQKGLNIIYGKGENDGFMGKNFQKYLDNQDIDGNSKRVAIDEYVKRTQEQFNISEDAISKQELNAIKKNMPIHRKYELIASNRLKDIFKKAGYSKVYKVKKLSEKDNNPDVVITKNGRTVLAIEIKGNTARGISVTFNYKKDTRKLEKTKLAQGKKETDNYKIKEESLIKTANEVFDFMIKAIEETIGKDGYRFSNRGNLQLTQDAVNIIKKQGVHLPIFKNIQFITTGDVANSYQQKKGKDGNLKPSHVIDMGNAGMFNMSVDSELQIEGLSNFADQKAPIPFTARVVFASLNKAKTHRTTFVRIEPQLNSLFFKKQNASLINKKDNKNVKFKFSKSQQISDKVNLANKAIENARKTSSFSKLKGASIFDFDETVGISENFVIAKKGNLTEKIASEDWPLVGETLKDQGYEFDFTDFNKVTKGKPGPLLQKMKNQIKKYGSKNVFILTARAPESQQAIHDWLESEGAKIPLENITGLGDSTGEAKAMWVLDKYANEGYNDIYFVDDALQNVQAVKNVLDQLDVKGKSVQARVKFSKSMDKEFNDILQDVTGIDSKKRFSDAKARKRGEGKGRFRFFVPPSHEDFVGLLYNFIGKGEKGNKHRDFFEKALIQPLNRAYRNLNIAKQTIANDYRNLTKQMPDIRKKLIKKIPDNDFTHEDAVRVYLWDKAGFEIPGLSKTDKKELIDFINSDQKLKDFANKIGKISRIKEGYVEPGDHWSASNIKQDLADATGRVGRKKFFTEFIENADIIFSPENINKIRAEFGDSFVAALQDMLHTSKTGTNRNVGPNKIVNAWLDYINGSVAATMFINVRSAVLQTLSTVNFINFGDNNIFKSAAAFANQKQFWSDFSMLFNSDYLKQRRAGAAFDLNASEIANAVGKSKNPVRAAISYLLEKGFLPTQMADSFAIALGGSSMYRNRVNTYLKQGLSKKEAEKKAFDDFMELAETTQQSARPDKLSYLQRSPLGRLIFAFQNVTSQYARIIKKSTLDIVNRRKSPPYDSQVKSDMSNLSRILYYGGIQNVIFYALQSAMFSMMFDDDERDEKFFEQKKDRILSGSIDSILRGSGIPGAVLSTIKNIAIKYHQQKEKGWNKEDNIIIQEALQLSPPIGIKARKLSSYERTMQFNRKVIPEMNTFDIDNPMWEAYANIIEGTTNAPTARFYTKQENIRAALDSRNQYWQRVFLFAGWDKWSLGVEDHEINAIKEELKKNSKQIKKKKVGIKKIIL